MSRESEDPRRIQVSTTADDQTLFQLKRADLAVLTQSYLQQSRSRRSWIELGVGIGGLAVGALLITVSEQQHWPTHLQPFFFFGGWAVMLGMSGRSWRRERRLRDKYRFNCPACDAPLLNGIRDGAGLARVEIVIATGVCPRCGTQILSP